MLCVVVDWVETTAPPRLRMGWHADDRVYFRCRRIRPNVRMDPFRVMAADNCLWIGLSGCSFLEPDTRSSEEVPGLQFR